MNRIPVGYRVRIRRKWPKVIFPVLIFFIVGLSFLLFKPDFSKITNLFASINQNIGTVQESVKFIDTIKEKKLEDVISENQQLINFDNPQEEKTLIFKPVNEVEIIKDNNEINQSNPETIKEKEFVNLMQTNVFDESENEELTISTFSSERSDFESDSLSLSSDKLESEIESIKDTIVVANFKYYVIVGSVKTKEKAKNQQKKFSAISENTDIIYESGINRYRISLGTYSSFKQASLKSKAFLAKHPNYKTWIWKTAVVSEE